MSHHFRYVKTHLTFDNKTAYCNHSLHDRATKLPDLAPFPVWKNLESKCGACDLRLSRNAHSWAEGKTMAPRLFEREQNRMARELTKRSKKRPSVADWILRDGSLEHNNAERPNWINPINRQLINGTASITFEELNGQIVSKISYLDKAGEPAELKYVLRKNAYGLIGTMIRDALNRL